MRGLNYMLHIWHSEKAPYSCPVLSLPDVPSYDHCLRQATELETVMSFSTATFVRSWAHILFQTHTCFCWQAEIACLLGFDLTSIPHRTLVPVQYCGPSIGVLLEPLKCHRLNTANLIHSRIHGVTFTAKKKKKEKEIITHQTGQLSLSDFISQHSPHKSSYLVLPLLP